MKHKIVILTVFIMLIAGISFVSAQDIGDSTLSTIDTDTVISVDESLDDDLGNVESEVISSSSNPTTVNTWTELDSALNGTTGYDTVNIGSSMAPTKQIVINHDVTIVGSSDTYIGGSDSNNKASYSYIPFMVTKDGLSVTLKNIRFQNSGNNIFIQLSGNGNYLIENCTFTNMTATGSHQSIVYLNNGQGNITDCRFENCTTSFGAVTNHRAGSYSIEMIVKGSTFKNNHATTEPGAINNCAKLIVYDSTFEDNSAVWWAGAIHTHMNANTTVVRSTFKNNIAGWNGGALYSYSTLTVINSTFTGNEAHQTSGGAIAASNYGSRPTVVVDNCDFNGNLAYGAGGAISFSGTSLTVTDSRFSDNTARSGNGGAISAGSTTTNVNNCNFTNNNASARGGAIYASGAGYLNIYYSNFVNDTANEGNDIAYYYTTKKTNAAFLNYDYNEFWGANNSSGSIYAYNTEYLVDNKGTHNVFHDISDYVVPSGDNDTNETLPTGDVTIPSDKEITASSWNTVLNGALSGAPVISGNYILVPANHNLYCFNYASHALVWNFTSEHGYFHEVLVENNIVYAPASYDALYLFYLNNGSSLTENNIYQGFSFYAPLLYNNIIYLSSEYGYGENNDTWISLVKYNGTDYYYDSSILTISGITYSTPAMLSKPYLYGNNIYVNTVNGLMSYNLNTGLTNSVIGTVGNPIIDADGYICILTDNGTSLSLLDSNLNSIDSVDLDGTCNMLVAGDNGKVYTVDENGYIYYANYDDSSLSCSKTEFYINPITTAMAYSNNKLYIGDNNGILWAFNIKDLNKEELSNSLTWACDVGSAITGGIVINNSIVYFGTVNGQLYTINN